MAYVRFNRPFDHRLDRRTIVAYPAKFEGDVPADHAKAAEAAGAAKRVKPQRGKASGDGS